MRLYDFQFFWIIRLPERDSGIWVMLKISNSLFSVIWKAEEKAKSGGCKEKGRNLFARPNGSVQPWAIYDSRPTSLHTRNDMQMNGRNRIPIPDRSWRYIKRLILPWPLQIQNVPKNQNTNPIYYTYGHNHPRVLSIPWPAYAARRDEFWLQFSVMTKHIAPQLQTLLSFFHSNKTKHKEAINIHEGTWEKWNMSQNKK